MGRITLAVSFDALPPAVAVRAQGQNGQLQIILFRRDAVVNYIETVIYCAGEGVYVSNWHDGVGRSRGACIMDEIHSQED